jgi:ADP-ribose pyrophosphatase YjhB (NUDIX family)
VSPAAPLGSGPAAAAPVTGGPALVRPAVPAKQRASALLLDGDDLVLFARDKPGLPRYWATPGGTVEPTDATILAALSRELDEELRAVVRHPLPVTMFDAPDPKGRWVRHHVFVCHLSTMDFEARYGPEFAKPEKGEYHVVRVPLTREALAGIDLQPAQLAAYLQRRLEHVRRQAGRTSYSYGIYFESDAPLQLLADVLRAEHGAEHMAVGDLDQLPVGGPKPAAWLNPSASTGPFGCELSGGDELYQLAGQSELALATELCRRVGTRALVSDESPSGSSWFLVARDGSYGRVRIHDEDDDPLAGQVRYALEPIAGEPDLPVVAAG